MGFALCVLGCGRFAGKFAEAVRSFKSLGTRDRLELYFASRDREKARAYSLAFDGAGYFGSYEEAAADPRIQAMYVCTPHHLHLEHTLLAARHTKHILVEKPIARTMVEGGKMVAAARDAGVQIMVAENYRFMPTIVKAKELIDSGALGAIRFIQIQEESIFSAESWRTISETMGGGVLIDGGIHSVDALIHLAGMPEEVYASELPRSLPDLEGEDGIVFMVRLKGGGAGLINHSWGMSRRWRDRWVAVSGTQGSLFFEPGKPTMTLETGDGKSVFRFPKDRHGIGNMVQEFRDHILANRSVPMSGEEGLKDLKVVLGAYQSAAEKRSSTITD